MIPERRKHPRYPVGLAVRLRIAGEDLPALLREVCRDAVLVEAERPFPAQTPAVVVAELPGSSGGAVELSGRVIRLAETDGARHQMALLLSDLTPAAATRIDLFLDSQAQGG